LILVDGGYVFPELVEGMTEEKALKGWEEYALNSHYPSWQDVINIYQDYTTRPWDSILDTIIQSNFRKENEEYLLKADQFSLLSIIKAIYHEPSSTTYHDIQCPVLFFHATLPESHADREKGIARIKKSIKTIKVIGLPHTKHNIHWDCPEKVADEILSWKQEVKEVERV
jgi:pimeloyl-ACP methyl ester carboxylesterase